MCPSRHSRPKSYIPMLTNPRVPMAAHSHRISCRTCSKTLLPASARSRIWHKTLDRHHGPAVALCMAATDPFRHLRLHHSSVHLDHPNRVPYVQQACILCPVQRHLRRAPAYSGLLASLISQREREAPLLGPLFRSRVPHAVPPPPRVEYARTGS